MSAASPASSASPASPALAARVGVSLGSLHLDVALGAAAGETVVVVGPNGAGKTTLLGALAGLRPLDRGRVVLDEVVLDDPVVGAWVPPEERRVGVVFQDHRLFPHLDLVENVAFGLRARRVPRDEARRRAGEWLERVGLAGLGAQRPAALSGGQAQRVALARALAGEPRLLLLDEPLAALDATTRIEIRHELGQHLDAFGGVRLIVTHDPLEALALADRVVVVEEGRVVQEGDPAEIAARPRTRYVADLVGVNLLRGRAEAGAVTLGSGFRLAAADTVPGLEAGVTAAEVLVVIHPRAVALYRSHPEGSPRNVWEGEVAGLDFEGSRVRVRVGGPVPVVAEVTPAAVEALGLAPGERVWCSVKAAEISLTPV